MTCVNGVNEFVQSIVIDDKWTLFMGFYKKKSDHIGLI